ESVKSAAPRAQQGGAGLKRKEVNLTQTTFGKDVTDLMKDLENAENATAQRNAAKCQKAISDANKRAITADKRVQQACSKLLGKAAGDSNHLSLADLVVLIKWRGGSVPENKTRDNKAELVRAWEAVRPPRSELYLLEQAHLLRPTKHRWPPSRARTTVSRTMRRLIRRMRMRRAALQTKMVRTWTRRK
ncbi:MAG: hypothetical protein SGPRY_010397, partial [Prymnesium sp.]